MNYIIIISFVIGIVLGGLILSLIFRKKLKKKVELDNQVIEEYNHKKELIKKDIEYLDNNKKTYETSINQFQQQIQDLEQKKISTSNQVNTIELQVNSLETKRQEILNSLDLLKKQQEEAASRFYDQAKYIAQQSFEKEIEKISFDLEDSRRKAQEEYLQTLKECKNYFDKEIAARTYELHQLDKEIEILDNEMLKEKHLVSSAIEVRKRDEAAAADKDFYRLQLSEIDIQEIKKLREVLPYLRNSEPLNKVIYKCYYEKPYTDLVGRVIGKDQKSGIYKITNINNGMAYVGKSSNLAERWRQHIKRGTGAETLTNNKLYPIMYEIGPENFTFEVIEECPVELLSEREQFWQNFYEVKTWGYSIK